MSTYYPPVSFHFMVQFQGLDKEDIEVRFQSVSGLSVDIQTESVKGGGENRFEYVLPVRSQYSVLVLKRGLVLNSQLIDWCMDAFQNLIIYPKNVLVHLLDKNQQSMMSWNVVQAWPKKWSTSDLNATGNEILIETLELQYQYFTCDTIRRSFDI